MNISRVSRTRSNRQAFRRTEDVDIKVDGNGGYYVGWIQSSEYLSYTVEVTENGE